MFYLSNLLLLPYLVIGGTLLRLYDAWSLAFIDQVHRFSLEGVGEREG